MSARLRGRLLGAVALLAIASAAGAAWAAPEAAKGAASSDGPTDVDVVVVTAPHYVPQESTMATKLATALLETPQSVTVISRDQIDLLNWQNLGQAVRYTAGVIGENFGSDERFDWLTQRGFNPVQYIDGLQAPVGSVSNSGLDLYAAQSVEILKGPASVLYGLAPPGGIVDITTRRPEDKFGGSVQVLYGSYNDKQIAGDITGAVNQYLSLRLTALDYDRGTQTDGVRSKRTYVAPAATWHIDPRTDLTLLAYYQWDEVQGDGGGFLPAAGIYSPNPVGRITPSMNLGDYAYNNFERRQYGVGYDFKHEFSGKLTFEQNLKYFSSTGSMLDVFGNGYVTSTSPGPGLYPYLNPLNGVQERDGSGNLLYSDYRTVQRSNFPITETIRSFNIDSRLTGQFNLGPVQNVVLAGIDYRHYTDLAPFGFSSAPTIDLFAPNHHQAIPTPALAFIFLDDTQDQLGVYGQDEAKLGNWILTATVREDWLRQTDPRVSQSPDAFSYRVGLNYVFPLGLSPYISYATSFQPTVATRFVGPNQPGGAATKPAYGDQVEAGVKFEPRFVPRAVKILATLAVYDLDQSNVLETDPNHPNFDIQTGSARVWGVEFEAVARIYERLTLNASYSYTETEVNNGPGPLTHLTLVPKNKVSVFADYTFQTGPLAGLGGGIGYRYNSSTYGDAANQWRVPGYGLVDAVAHYDIAKWRFSVDASNLLNTIYISQCDSEVDCFYGLGRKVVVTITRKF